MSKKLLGHVGVDAGMLMIGDPCYFIGKDATVNTEVFRTWSEACEKLFCAPNVDHKKPYLIENGCGAMLGIAVSTTYGDGSYPVYLETYKDGKGRTRRRMLVELD